MEKQRTSEYISALSVAQTPPTTNDRQTDGPAVCAATCPVLQVGPTSVFFMIGFTNHGNLVGCDAVNEEITKRRI